MQKIHHKETLQQNISALEFWHNAILAKQATNRLCPGMLCLADRLFPSFQLWRRFAATGADLLWRAKISMPLKKIKVFADGSYLAEWLPKTQRSLGRRANIVRVIEYRLGDSCTSENKGEIYRLITTILDPAKASPEELAKLYPQRWEIEITVKEGKAILRKGKITLRSKLPELVKQEFWGMILAHYLVRKTMAQAALDSGQDPDDLSYDGCIEIIKATQSGSVLSFSP